MPTKWDSIKNHLNIFTFVSALICVLAFPQWNFSFLIWIGFAPFLFALWKSSSFKETLRLGIIWSLTYTVFGFYWAAYALHQYGELPWIISGIGLLFLGLFNQWTIVVYALFRFFLQKKFLSTVPSSRSYFFWIFGNALFFSCFDTLMPKIFHDSFGHALYQAEYLRQVVDIGGVALLTFVIFLSNELLCFIFLKFKDEIFVDLKKISIPFIIFCLLLTSYLLYGQFSYYKYLNSIEQSPKINMAIIQGNIGDFDRVSAQLGIREAANSIIDTFISLSEEALLQNPRPSIIVWPETTYPSIFRKPGTTYELARDQKLENFVSSKNVALFFGGYDSDADNDYNSLYFLTPNQKNSFQKIGNLQIYHKHVLLPFGEYLPGLPKSDWIKKMFPTMGFFAQGPGSEVFSIPLQKDVETLRVIPIICYEALESELVLRAAQKNANLILNISNDSWFGPYGEPYLHLALSVFRSLETRLPQVRATNTGISTLIQPTGDLIRPTVVMTQTIAPYEVSLIENPKKSLMVQFSVSIKILLSILGVSFLLFFLPDNFLRISKIKKVHKS